jgi:uncharacterized protein (DUF1697 family)
VATQIALLRGINLGASRRVRMEALRELLAGHGYGNVRTYVQSGNIVLDSPARAKQLERTLERQLAAGLGFQVDVFVRTRTELARVLERNPLAGTATDPSRYLVTFLRAAPTAKLAAQLGAIDLAPEQLAVSGREIYSWHPDGVGRSELAKRLSERILGTTATARNWKTIEKLLALAADE